ncbi:helix-turn-helix domain-containing protein [Aquibacillus kalidii]|uniref:helix-turn-helix domain-containing protein n=1 Tax=Aquibacillus kalidii TaxID=2762597 RepID=UPI001648D158|nr:RodZ domain-containing protein [Aquibacillus kalidii]
MELGLRLKEAREAKKLSLDDVQKITKIQTRYLQAIEKGNLDIMPGNFYIRAFIKEYATAVGLDPDQLMEEYSSELPKTNTSESTIQYTRVQRSRKDTTTSKSPAILSFLPTVIVVLLIIGILVTIWYFRQDGFNGDNDQPKQTEENKGGDEVQMPKDTGEEVEPETDPESTNDEAETTEEDNDEAETLPTLNIVEKGNGETTYELTNPGDKVELELSSESEHWLELENGKGKSFYNNMFYAADSPLTQDMTGEEQIYLRFGNPTKLNIKVNGVALQLPDDIDASQVQKVWIKIVNE